MLFMQNIGGRRTLSAMGLGILALIPAICLGKSKPRMVVVLHMQYSSNMGTGEVVTVHLVLPDGTHASGQCMTLPSGPPCIVDPFAPEKRLATACIDKSSLQTDDSHPKAQILWCTYDESYYADRKVNDITLYAANGKVTYHITNSW